MDRLFLDANVLFSAAYRQDSGLLRLWRLDRVVLLTSAYALEEARRNCLDAAQRDRLASLVVGLEVPEDPAGRPARSARLDLADLPENDRPILQAAVALHATHLLTGDRRAFGQLFGREVQGVLVLRPADYLRRRAE